MNQPVPDELISAYFDGEVTADEREQVESLLESSIEFRQQLDDTSKLSALLHSFPRESAPVELAAQVQKRVDKLPMNVPSVTVPKRQSLRREWTAFGAGIFATMASLLLFVAFHQSQLVSEFGLVATSETAGFKSSRSFEVARKEAESIAVVAGALEKTPLNASDDYAKIVTSDTRVLDGASNHALGLQLSEASNNSIEASPFGPPGQEEFLSSLRQGEVFVRQFVDPSNTVFVVECTVVDIIKGAEEWELLLQNRHIQRFHEGESNLAEVDSKDTPNGDGRHHSEKPAASNKMLGYFVCAKGDELADAITESLKDHSDNFKRLEMQLPISLSVPVNLVANVTNFGDRDESSVKSKESAPKTDQQTASAEAMFSASFYADSNGLMIETPAAFAGLKKADVSDIHGRVGSDKVTELARVASGSRSIKSDNSIATFESDKPEGGAATQNSSKGNGSANPPASNSLDEESTKRLSEAGNSPQGYTTFRYAVAGQQSQKQQHAPIQNSAMAAGVFYNNAPNAPAVMNNGIVSNNAIPGNNLGVAFNNNATVLNGNGALFGNNAFYSQGNSVRRYVRSSTDIRDPRLVKMLVVLKPEQITPATTP